MWSRLIYINQRDGKERILWLRYSVMPFHRGFCHLKLLGVTDVKLSSVKGSYGN